MRKSATYYEQCFMNEIRQKEEDTKLFWESFGSWKDDRSAEKIIDDIYASRLSENRDIQL